MSGDLPPLRIGILPPPPAEVPPRGFAGVDDVVAGLADRLTRAGHAVVVARDPRDLAGAGLDLVHDHRPDGTPLELPSPTVLTVHGPVGGVRGERLRRLPPSVHLVAVAESQRREAPRLDWAATVPNGVDVDAFPFRDAEARSEEVLWIGRFTPDKGAHLAIEAARTAGRRILLAGTMREPAERRYFEGAIAPRLGSGVEYVGEPDAALRRALCARAACLVFPVQWEGPYGTLLVEAMACGTPVVATRRGCVPELVVDGQTGVLVDELGDLPLAIGEAAGIDPAACRTHVARRFDLGSTAAGYEALYRALVSRDRPLTGLPRAA